MRALSRVALGTLVVAQIAAGCAREPEPLVLLAGPIEPAPRAAEVIARILHDRAGIRVDVRSGADDAANLAALRAGEADLTIAADLATPMEELTSLAALYPGALHVLYHAGSSPAMALSDLLAGERVFADAPGSATRELLESLVRLEPGSTRRTSFAASPWDEGVKAYFSIGGLLDPGALRDLSADLRLFSFDLPGTRPGERVVDGISLRLPHVRAFALPAKLYPELRSEAATTLAIHHWLVSSRSLDRALATEIARTLADERSRLRAVVPISALSPVEDFDRSTYSFPAHPGALDFLRREEPTLLQRYTDLIGLLLSVALAIVSCAIAFRNWNRRRRKDRIDAYSEQVLALVAAADAAGADRADLVAELRRIERHAFSQLVAERLDPDASFQIFLLLCRSAISDVEAGIPSNRSGDLR